MTTPEWLKPGIYGALIGATALAIVGFAWGGWVTGGTAQDMAENRAQEELTSAMVPVCLDKALADPQRSAKLETIGAATRFRQRDALMDAGWATMPGSDSPDRDIAQACLDAMAARAVDEG
ncbi:MAG: hypothetical protein CML66_06530 [Rhodobacteraceae bacterium]|nr:hypothetical protein [Paracoccaceae bacterium]MAY45577.1 hypothetical protein [Paracoccaceae bacterium]QEW21659.1 hypothetical protein LA6_003871 [Marinibacterium anthonyi]